MAVTVRRLRRAESWTDWKAAGGTRQYVVDKVLSCRSRTSLINDQLSLVVALGNPALEHLLTRTIIRLDQSDSVYDEWLIVDRATDEVAGTVTLTAASIRSTEVSESALIERDDSDGVVVFDFESLGLTPEEHITQWILPALATAGITWIDIGTITPIAPIDMAFQWDTPLSALLHIASVTQCELDIRRNGDTEYLIDLISKVNETAQRADMRIDKNLVNITADEDTIDQATRVFPRGANAEESSATMSRALWKVDAVASNVLTLSDPAGGPGPIQVDDQLNNRYLRKPDGTLTQVNDCDATNQTVTVASAAGLAVDDQIQFRYNSWGKDLVYLDDPAAIADYGIKVGIKDVPNTPGTNNLLKNPFMRDWPSTLPVGWSEVGAPTTTKQTAAPYTAMGGASIKVESTDAGEGVVSDTMPLSVSPEHPYISGYGRLWVVSGSVRVELVLITPDGEVIMPVGPVASNSIIGQWEDLGVSGINGDELEATEAAIRIVQNGSTPAVFYVDAAQLTESPSQEPLVEGSGGTALWQAANEVLRTSSLPKVQYSIPLVDLEQLDPVKWAETALIIGAPARVRSPRLDVDILTRLLEINRDYINANGTSVVLSNKFDDLTDFLAAFHRRGRRTPTTTEPESGESLDISVPPLLNIRINRANSKLTAIVIGGPGTYQTRALARLDRYPTGDELDASSPSPAGQKTGVFVDILQLVTAKRFYVAGRAYNEAGEGTAIQTLEGEWLGIDATPGADVVIGTITSLADKIIFEVAFDLECAYCLCWITEWTTDPGTVASVEGVAAQPFRILELGKEAFEPGISQPVAFPISGPDNFLGVTFVPFDHLAKRGPRPKTYKIQGSLGIIGDDGEDAEDPLDIFGAALAVWYDPVQQTGYSDDDELIDVDDFSGNANTGTADFVGEGIYAIAGNARYKTNQHNGLPMFRFVRSSAAFNTLVQWIDTPPDIATLTDGCFMLVVGKRIDHHEHNIVARFATTANPAQNFARVTETHGDGFNNKLQWRSAEANVNKTIDASLTTDLFAYGIRFASVSEALQWFNGIIDATNGTFDPSGDADQLGFWRIGEGDYLIGDFIFAVGDITFSQVSKAFTYVNKKWSSSVDVPLGPQPDPPAGAVQVDQTSSSITINVEMPATAPDYIRIYMASRVIDVAVTVGGGAIQTIVIDGLSPNKIYRMLLKSVEDGVESFPLIIFTHTDPLEDEALDTPAALTASYSRGDQSIVIHLDRTTLNHPSDTDYLVEASDVSGGPYSSTASVSGAISGAVVSIPFPWPQRPDTSQEVYYRVKAISDGWPDSNWSAEESIFIFRSGVAPLSPP